HYYEGRLRPRHAYSMGLIQRWAKVASLMPGLVNAVGKMPVVSNVVKWMGGISQKRSMPQFAPETFHGWWKKREPKNAGKTPVILWVDTFNNHFHPQTLQAAAQALEETGHRVLVPPRGLCCGRPLYDFGMLDEARRLLSEILVSMREQIRAGTPVIGLEPSCVSVFRDELKRLFPFDEDAKRLCQNTKTLSEFLVDQEVELPRLNRKVMVHGHCHHKAVMSLKAERKLYERAGLEFEILDSGC